MTQMNISTKQKKRLTERENGLVVAKGEGGEGRIRSLGLADANYYIQDG